MSSTLTAFQRRGKTAFEDEAEAAIALAVLVYEDPVGDTLDDALDAMHHLSDYADRITTARLLQAACVARWLNAIIAERDEAQTDSELRRRYESALDRACR